MSVELTQKLAERNLAVGTWENQKGDKHVSLSRIGRYTKNIAIPVELVPAVVEALTEKMKEIQ